MPVFTKRKSKLHIQLTNSDQATAHGGQVLIDALCRRFDLWKRLHDEPSLDPLKRTGSGFLRIPINSDTCSNPFRTVFRDIRTVVGAKRRSASTFRRVSELSQAFPLVKSVFGA